VSGQERNNIDDEQEKRWEVLKKSWIDSMLTAKIYLNAMGRQYGFIIFVRSVKKEA